MAKVRNILKELPKLTQDDLEQVEARLILLKSKGTDDKDERLLHDQLAELLQDVTSERVPPLHVIGRFKHYPAFSKGVPVFMAYVRKGFKPRGPARRVQAVKLCLGLIVHYLQARKVPISHKAVCQQLAKVSNAVEDQFPAYRASGLLPLLLTKIRQ